MYYILSFIARMSEINTTIKVVILGCSCVGKSSVIDEYIYDTTKLRIPKRSHCVNFELKTTKYNNFDVKLLMWDIWGGDKFKGMGRDFYKDAPAIVLMYDVSDRNSFDEIDIWMKDIRKNITQRPYDVILIANKIDKSNRCVSEKEGSDKARKLGFYAYCETTIKNKQTIDDAFNKLIEKVIANRITLSKIVKATIDNDKSCCTIL